MRVSVAIVPAESVIAGSTKLRSESAPVAGNHLRFSAKESWSSRPMTKLGSEAKSIAVTMETLSTMEYWRMAEMTPTGTPTSVASIMASVARHSVVGKRARISSKTGSLVW